MTPYSNDGLTADLLPQWWPKALGNLTFPLGWKGGDPVAWRRGALEAVRALVLEEPFDGPWSPRVVHRELRDGYRLDVVSVRLGNHRRSLAYLAVPEGPGPFPAALVLHDHGAHFTIGKEKMLSPPAGHPRADEARAWAQKNYGGRFVGDEWARAGWVVLATDALGWGDRVCTGYESQQAVASNLFNLGSSWAGVIASEDAAAAAWLSSLPFVDAHRVVSVGHSMGGYRSYQVAALSDHVKAAVAACCFATLEGVMVPGGNRTRGQSAFTMTHPGLFRLLDFPDLAALAAPKPLHFVHGVTDALYPIEAVRRAVAHASPVWAARGASVPTARERQGGHAFDADDQQAALVWLEGLPWENAGVASSHAPC